MELENKNENEYEEDDENKNIINHFDTISYHFIFPYDVYQENQEQIIQNIRDTLLEKKACIIVARNGTGKTILVLSACMSIKNNGIIILTRTHRQMIHFVKEIDLIRGKKNIDKSYIELQSRNEYCINPSVKNLEKNIIDMKCFQNLIKNGNYCLYNGISDTKKIKILTSTKNLNLEKIKYGNITNIKNYGIQNDICPYYISRLLVMDSAIILGTYMYLDKDIRRALNLNVKNKIIVIDEAHNLLNFLEEKQKKTIQLNTINFLINICKNQNYNKIFPFLERCKQFILQIYTSYKEKNDIKISYNVFYEYSKKYKITESLLSEIGMHLKELTANIKNFDFIYKISQILSFFELFNQVTEDTFLGYINIFQNEKEKNKIHDIQIGIQSIDIAPLIHEIINEGAKIVFISGTLNSSMFNFRLQLEHISHNVYEYPTNKQRIQTYIIGIGKKSQKLTTNYYSRNDTIYEEYGTLIQRLLQSIPEGTLIFFPSYEYKKKCLEYWNKINLITIKQNMMYFNLTNTTCIPLYDDISDENIDAIEEFKENVKKEKSILTSVFRSKGSEGENYTNIKGIFIIGIPFANVSDSSIKLKINYYNKLKTNYGNIWYTTDAIDAVNQACGRGIRKNHDYCALFLLDFRYTQSTYFNYLSEWIRNGTILFPNTQTIDTIITLIEKNLNIFYMKNKKINILKKLE